MNEFSNRHHPMIIKARPVNSYAISEIRSPYDRKIVGTCPVANAATVDAAVRAARVAFPAWSGLPDGERAEFCRRIAAVFQDNAAELATLVTREQGKPLDAGGFGSEFEIAGCVGWSMATAAMTLPEEVLPVGDGVHAVQRRVPKGVIGSITPWNWPLLIAVWHILPALRTGNCVVIKPSELTPLSTLRAVELLNEILPPGVLNAVAGDGAAGAALATHPGIDKMIFTGSTATGKKIMQSAAQNVTDCSLELGGNDPAIVLPGTPVDEIAQGLFFGAFINAGQTCGAIKRIYVPQADHDALVEALAEIARNTVVGDGLDDGVAMGPVQNEPQYDKVRRLTEQAVAAGATLAAGGEALGTGFALRPAILGHCRQDMAIVAEEQFGPALPIVPYRELTQAVEWANEGDFGLCASVWGSEGTQRDRIVQAIRAGTVYINTHAELNPMVPFGGIKSSGIGVQFGTEGLKSFTDSKVVYERAAA